MLNKSEQSTEETVDDMSQDMETATTLETMQDAPVAEETAAAPRPSFFQGAIKPAAVLVGICATAGLLLGFVNNLTLPVILENREARQRIIYEQLMPEATNFVAQTIEVEGVTASLVVEEDLGYIVVSQAKGYSGQVPVAVGFSPEGTIISVIPLDNTETPGLGDKNQLFAFTDQFAGIESDEVTFEDVDAITGATISSKAVLDAVNQAIQAEIIMSGGTSAPTTEATKEGEGA